jgi:sphinganine-1-phosphate aldolase
MSRFPETGRPREEVLSDLLGQRARDLQSDGRAFAFVYDAGEEVRGLLRDAYAGCMGINGLDPTVYPSARTLENAVVAAYLELLRAPEGAVGTATAGGTESVMMAVKTARDYARKTRPDVQRPAMLLPVTAHACFHKAGHYLGVEVIPVAVNPLTFRADVEDARAKMTDQVVLVVGSAPSYAHGVIDDIPALAALAQAHGALMHVDACVGGCVLPHLREIGVEVPPFDFTVEGVTSISVDLHKYGFAPKGVSVLLQRRPELRAAQYYACAKWTGYPVVNSTSLGSKSVAALGAAYALLHHLGRDGYRTRARAMWDATQRLSAVVAATPGLRLLGPRRHEPLRLHPPPKATCFVLARPHDRPRLARAAHLRLRPLPRPHPPHPRPRQRRPRRRLRRRPPGRHGRPSPRQRSARGGRPDA